MGVSVILSTGDKHVILLIGDVLVTIKIKFQSNGNSKMFISKVYIETSFYLYVYLFSY